jgi:hypothetical protein
MGSYTHTGRSSSQMALLVNGLDTSLNKHCTYISIVLNSGYQAVASGLWPVACARVPQGYCSAARAPQIYVSSQ